MNDFFKIKIITFLEKIKLIFIPMQVSVDVGIGDDYTSECKFKKHNGHIYIFDCKTYVNNTSPNKKLSEMENK